MPVIVNAPRYPALLHLDVTALERRRAGQLDVGGGVLRCLEVGVLLLNRQAGHIEVDWVRIGHFDIVDRRPLTHAQMIDLALRITNLQTVLHCASNRGKRQRE